MAFLILVVFHQAPQKTPLKVILDLSEGLSVSLETKESRNDGTAIDNAKTKTTETQASLSSLKKKIGKQQPIPTANDLHGAINRLPQAPIEGGNPGLEVSGRASGPKAQTEVSG
jgi:hypothetical protein